MFVCARSIDAHMYRLYYNNWYFYDFVLNLNLFPLSLSSKDHNFQKKFSSFLWINALMKVFNGYEKLLLMYCKSYQV